MAHCNCTSNILHLLFISDGCSIRLTGTAVAFYALYLYRILLKTKIAQFHNKSITISETPHIIAPYNNETSINAVSSINNTYTNSSLDFPRIAQNRTTFKTTTIQYQDYRYFILALIVILLLYIIRKCWKRKWRSYTRAPYYRRL